MADWNKDMQGDEQTPMNEEANVAPAKKGVPDDTTEPARERYSAERYDTDPDDPNSVVDDPASLFIQEPDVPTDENEPV